MTNPNTADGGRWRTVTDSNGIVRYIPIDSTAKMIHSQSLAAKSEPQVNASPILSPMRIERKLDGSELMFYAAYHPWMSNDEVIARLKAREYKESMLLLEGIYDLYSKVTSRKMDGPHGMGMVKIQYMDRECFNDFCQAYRSDIDSGPQEHIEVFIDRVWSTLDYSNNGYLEKGTFCSAMLALDPHTRQDNSLGLVDPLIAPITDRESAAKIPFDVEIGTMNRLKWVFRFFNADRSGYLSLLDICSLLDAIMRCYNRKKRRVKESSQVDYQQRQMEAIEDERLLASIKNTIVDGQRDMKENGNHISPGISINGYEGSPIPSKPHESGISSRSLYYGDAYTVDYSKLMNGDHHTVPMKQPANPKPPLKSAFDRNSLMNNLAKLSACSPTRLIVSNSPSHESPYQKSPTPVKGPILKKHGIHGGAPPDSSKSHTSYSDKTPTKNHILSPVEGALLYQSTDLLLSDCPESGHLYSEGITKIDENVKPASNGLLNNIPWSFSIPDFPDSFSLFQNCELQPVLCDDQDIVVDTPINDEHNNEQNDEISPSKSSAKISSPKDNLKLQNGFLTPTTKNDDRIHTLDIGDDSSEDLLQTIDKFSEAVSPDNFRPLAQHSTAISMNILSPKCYQPDEYLQPPVASMTMSDRVHLSPAMPFVRTSPNQPPPEPYFDIDCSSSLSSIRLQGISLPSSCENETVDMREQSEEEIETEIGESTPRHSSRREVEQTPLQYQSPEHIRCGPSRKKLMRFFTFGRHGQSIDNDPTHYHPDIQAMAEGLLATFAGKFPFNAFCQCIALEWINIDDVFRFQRSIIFRRQSEEPNFRKFSSPSRFNKDGHCCDIQAGSGGTIGDYHFDDPTSFTPTPSIRSPVNIVHEVILPPDYQPYEPSRQYKEFNQPRSVYQIDRNDRDPCASQSVNIEHEVLLRPDYQDTPKKADYPEHGAHHHYQNTKPSNLTHEGIDDDYSAPSGPFYVKNEGKSMTLSRQSSHRSGSIIHEVKKWQGRFSSPLGQSEPPNTSRTPAQLIQADYDYYNSLNGPSSVPASGYVRCQSCHSFGNPPTKCLCQPDSQSVPEPYFLSHDGDKVFLKDRIEPQTSQSYLTTLGDNTYSFEKQRMSPGYTASQGCTPPCEAHRGELGTEDIPPAEDIVDEPQPKLSPSKSDEAQHLAVPADSWGSSPICAKPYFASIHAEMSISSFDMDFLSPNEKTRDDESDDLSPWLEEEIKIMCDPASPEISEERELANVEVNFTDEDVAASPPVRIALVDQSPKSLRRCSLCQQNNDSENSTMLILLQNETCRRYSLSASSLARHASDDLHHFASSAHILGTLLTLIQNQISGCQKSLKDLHTVVHNPCIDVLELNINAIREREGRTIVVADPKCKAIIWDPHAGANSLWDLLMKVGIYEKSSNGEVSFQPTHLWPHIAVVIEEQTADICSCLGLEQTVYGMLTFLALKALSPEKIHLTREIGIFQFLATHLLRDIAEASQENSTWIRNTLRLISLWTLLPCGIVIPRDPLSGEQSELILPKHHTWEQSPIKRDNSLSCVRLDPPSKLSILADIIDYMEPADRVHLTISTRSRDRHGFIKTMYRRMTKGERQNENIDGRSLPIKLFQR